MTATAIRTRETMKEGGWFWVQNEVIRDYGPKVGAGGIAVYTCLAMAVGTDGRVDISRGQIAAMLGVSLPTVSKYIASLEKVGLLTVSRSGWHNENGWETNAYTLIDVHASPSKNSLLDIVESTTPSKDSLLPLVKDFNYPSKNSLHSLRQERQEEKTPLYPPAQQAEGIDSSLDRVGFSLSEQSTPPEVVQEPAPVQPAITERPLQPSQNEDRKWVMVASDLSKEFGIFHPNAKKIAERARYDLGLAPGDTLKWARRLWGMIEHKSSLLAYRMNNTTPDDMPPPPEPLRPFTPASEFVAFPPIPKGVIVPEWMLAQQASRQ